MSCPPPILLMWILAVRGLLELWEVSSSGTLSGAGWGVDRCVEVDASQSKQGEGPKIHSGYWLLLAITGTLTLYHGTCILHPWALLRSLGILSWGVPEVSRFEALQFL